MMPKNIIDKPVAATKKYCTDCKEFITGVGSGQAPYRCECGIYDFHYDERVYKLKVVHGN